MQKTTVTKIRNTDVNVGGETQVSDLRISNEQGEWWGSDLGGGDWDYLQDNGDYEPFSATDYCEQHISQDDLDQYHSECKHSENLARICKEAGVDGFTLWGAMETLEVSIA